MHKILGEEEGQLGEEKLGRDGGGVGTVRREGRNCEKRRVGTVRREGGNWEKQRVGTCHWDRKAEERLKRTTLQY